MVWVSKLVLKRILDTCMVVDSDVEECLAVHRTQDISGWWSVPFLVLRWLE